MFRRSLFWGILVSVGVTAGCGERGQARSTHPARTELSEASPIQVPFVDDPVTSSNTDVVEVAPPAKSVELVEANWNELQSLIQKQSDKIVVVDVWSTACEPCMKEFPYLIALQQRFPDDVVAISFDVDYAGIKNKPAEFYRERVLKFLGSQLENNVLHRMCTTPAEDLFNEIKLDSIPAVYVYGRDGIPLKRFDGSNSEGEGVSYIKQVTPFVFNLLKENASK